MKFHSRSSGRRRPAFSLSVSSAVYFVFGRSVYYALAEKYVYDAQLYLIYIHIVPTQLIAIVDKLVVRTHTEVEMMSTDRLV